MFEILRVGSNMNIKVWKKVRKRISFLEHKEITGVILFLGSYDKTAGLEF